MITIKNTTVVAQKVMYQIVGKEYGVPVDGQETQLAPFDETVLQPGEEIELGEVVDGWIKVVDLTGVADQGDIYFG